MAEARVDGAVAELGERHAAIVAELLADAVEHDDRVVHGVADDREKRGDHDERHLAPAKREDRERDERVVRERDESAEAEAELEAEADVDQDRDEREEDGVGAALLEVRANHRTDLVDRGGSDFCLRELLAEQLRDVRADVLAFELGALLRLGRLASLDEENS